MPSTTTTVRIGLAAVLCLNAAFRARAGNADSLEKPESAARAQQPVDHPIVPGFERFFAQTPAKSDATREPVGGGLLLLGELNCTSCHRAGEAVERSLLEKQAPVLDDVGSRVKREHLREFVADPQHVKPGTTMPGVFGRFSPQEKERRVEALVHFLASTGSVREVFPSEAAARRGEKLFHEAGCVACHNPRQPDAPTLPTSVPLGDLTAKYSITSLAGFLRNPLAVRPSGRMPHLHLEDKDARALANFFVTDADVQPNLRYTYFEGSWENTPDFAEMKPKAEGKAAGFNIRIARRKNNFGLRFAGFLHIEREGDYTFHLGSDDGSRLSIDGEQIVLNDGHHPFTWKVGKTHLAAGAHPVTVDYFQAGGEWELQVEYEGPQVARQPLAGAVSLTDEPPDEHKDRFRVDPALADKGQRYFAELGCAACHRMKRGGDAVQSTAQAPALAELDSGQGCLAASPAADVPDFHLSHSQRAALRTGLDALPGRAEEPRTPSEAIAHTMTVFNCYACHERNDRGGVERARNDFFETTTPEMGDEGRIPPPLNGVGDKLTTNWLRKVVADGASHRDYMFARMPKFGGDNTGHLVEAFVKADRKNGPERPAFDRPLYRVKSAGRHMVGGKALSCIKCHGFGQYEATGIQAAELTTMTRRLREDWFYRYMRDPQDYRPGTRMPAAWPRGRTVLPDVLDGDTQKQLAAIWLYLSDGKNARVPEGLIPNPIELVPEKKPVVYRNFIEGLSPRGIAVGYPAGVNLAFDAGRLHLALIWHGAFIDASQHWRGRGRGRQPPLGKHVLSLADGSPFARLASRSTPWPEKSADELGWEFDGYRLDDKGRPAFRYGFERIEVRDFPVPMPRKPDPGLERTLTLRADEPPENLWYRAAVGETIEQLQNGTFIVDDGLRVRLETEAPGAPFIRNNGNRAELLVPVRFEDGEARIVQTYVW